MIDRCNVCGSSIYDWKPHKCGNEFFVLPLEEFEMLTNMTQKEEEKYPWPVEPESFFSNGQNTRYVAEEFFEDNFSDRFDYSKEEDFVVFDFDGCPMFYKVTVQAVPEFTATEDEGILKLENEND
jgi:hypothetical protein